MSREPQLIVCGGIDLPDTDPLCVGKKVVRLSTSDNVHLKLEDVTRSFGKYLTPRLADLLEIATYVYAADSSSSREGWKRGGVERWSRDFTFVIPVDDLYFWTQDETLALLKDTLQFLSGDTYTFDFRQYKRTRYIDGYLDYKDDEWDIYGIERVVMFSGGLDSLAGAVEMGRHGEHLVLVSHRSVSVMDTLQKRLYEELKKEFPNQVTRIPVWVFKDSNLSKDYSQRTRSFLFSALGTCIGASLNAGGGTVL